MIGVVLSMLRVAAAAEPPSGELRRIPAVECAGAFLQPGAHAQENPREMAAAGSCREWECRYLREGGLGCGTAPLVVMA